VVSGFSQDRQRRISQALLLLLLVHFFPSKGRTDWTEKVTRKVFSGNEGRTGLGVPCDHVLGIGRFPRMNKKSISTINLFTLFFKLPDLDF
jgi:hypothetical protein